MYDHFSQVRGFHAHWSFNALDLTQDHANLITCYQIDCYHHLIKIIINHHLIVKEERAAESFLFKVA